MYAVHQSRLEYFGGDANAECPDGFEIASIVCFRLKEALALRKCPLISFKTLKELGGRTSNGVTRTE